MSGATRDVSVLSGAFVVVVFCALGMVVAAVVPAILFAIAGRWPLAAVGLLVTTNAVACAWALKERLTRDQAEAQREFWKREHESRSKHNAWLASEWSKSNHRINALLAELERARRSRTGGTPDLSRLLTELTIAEARGTLRIDRRGDSLLLTGSWAHRIVRLAIPDPKRGRR